MLINLLEEYPIIAIEEAHLLGQVNGAILQENILTSLLCINENEGGIHNFQIPINRIILGANAVMVQSSSAAHILAPDSQIIKTKMGVYTPKGDLVGKVTAIHISRDRAIKGIHTENGYIKIDDIIKIGSVIIADFNDSNCVNDTIAETEEMLLSMGNKEPDKTLTISLINNDGIEQESIVETLEESVENAVEAPSPEKTPHLSQEESDDFIYSKYNYLLDKKIISSISIAEQTFIENTVINKGLIETALKNNCILNLIMSAED